MEYDDLHEPAETVPGERFFDSIQSRTQRYSSWIHPSPVVSLSSSITFYSQPEARHRHRTAEAHLNSTVVHSETRLGNIARAPVQRPVYESVSLLSDLPVTTSVKLEDDLGDPARQFGDQGLGLRMRDDLDEPLEQPPLQRSRFELVDDLDEPEDLPEASETEFRDDLHELEEPPPPARMTLDNDLHDDLDDPVVCPQSDPRMNDHGLFDDLDEPIAAHQPAHHELKDDLDEYVETGQGSSTSTVGSELDHLYDDLDELVVDELISEVSDLVLQGRCSSGGRKEGDLGDFRSQLGTYSADPATRRSSADQDARSAHHAANFIPISQERQDALYMSHSESRRESPEIRGATNHQTASERTATVGNSNSIPSGETSTSDARGGAPRNKNLQAMQHVKVQQMPPESSHSTQHTEADRRSTYDSQKTRCDGSRPTLVGPDLSHRSDAAVSTAGDVPRWSASSAAVAVTKARNSSSQSAENWSKCFPSGIRPGSVGPQCAGECHVRWQLRQSGDEPEPMHSNTPASHEPMLSDAAPSSNFPPENGGSQPPPSPPQLPLLQPRSASARPPSPSSSQSELLLPPPLLPLTSNDDKLPPPPPTEATARPQHAETSASCPPINNNSLPPLPPVVAAAPRPPMTPATSTSSAQGSGISAVPRYPTGDRVPRRPVQTETVVERIDALLAAVTACRQRGETPELLLPAKTRWRDVQLCSA